MIIIPIHLPSFMYLNNHYKHKFQSHGIFAGKIAGVQVIDCNEVSVFQLTHNQVTSLLLFGELDLRRNPRNGESREVAFG